MCFPDKGHAAMDDEAEKRRRRNAKRWLWLIVAGCVALAVVIAYTSLRAPDPNSRNSTGPAATAAAGPLSSDLRNESQPR
jgi:hypothetical protein